MRHALFIHFVNFLKQDLLSFEGSIIRMYANCRKRHYTVNGRSSTTQTQCVNCPLCSYCTLLSHSYMYFDTVLRNIGCVLSEKSKLVKKVLSRWKRETINKLYIDNFIKGHVVTLRKV